MTRSQMLAAVVAFRDLFKHNESTIPFGHLQTQLDAMERRLIDGDVPQEEWEQFQMQFAAFQGELMGSLRKRGAMIAMSAEAHWLRDPQRFANDANAQKLIRWWREEGGRKQWLGSLPIADRRELEALELKWRANPPGTDSGK